MLKFCWHNWSKWEQYIEEGTVQAHPFSKNMLPYSEKRQKRICSKCGKIQEISIKK